MKRWLPILLILAAGILGAFWLACSDAPKNSAPGKPLSSNAVARVRVSGGGQHALVIAPDGSLWSWGEASSSLGQGNVTRPLQVPERAGKDHDWAEIYAGYHCSLALKRDGSLWAWGSNPSGMLGDGTQQTRDTPTRIGSDTNWIFAGAGLHHSAGLKRDGTLWTWGANNFGQLGVPELATTTNQSFIPVRVGSETNWKALAVGSALNIALKSDGTLWTWGDSSLTPAITTWATNNQQPVQIGTDTNWAAIAAGYYHCLAIKRDGTLWNWGRNAHLVGGIPPKDLSQPRAMQTDAEWSAVHNGAYGNLARKQDGSLWELGSGGRVAEVRGPWVAASSGSGFAIAVAPDGSLWHWGSRLGESRSGPAKLWHELLKKVGVRPRNSQLASPTRQSPEVIFQLPGREDGR